MIPAVGIIVSLIGTFAFMKVAGFSVNLLTLFALVLVIGTVVDDSIVVVEAVKARFDEGYTSALKATEDAMSGLSVTLFTTTLVFMVIFIPVAFMGGTTGIFFKQFGLTMAVAVGISLVNALTLSPALCALILRPPVETFHEKSLQPGASSLQPEKSTLQSWIHTAYESTFSALLKHYAALLQRLLKRKAWVAGSVALALLLFGILFKVVPTGFIPNEDMGTLFVDLMTPSGYTANKTFDLMNHTCDKIRELPEVQEVGGVVGVGAGSNSANIFIQLKPWKERKGKAHSSTAVMERINGMLAQETEAQSFVSEPGMVEGYGGNGGFEFSVQGRNGQDAKTVHEVTTHFTEKLSGRPEIGEVYSSYDVNYPQYRVDLDVARCKKMGV